MDKAVRVSMVLVDTSMSRLRRGGSPYMRLHEQRVDTFLRSGGNLTIEDYRMHTETVIVPKII